MLPYYFLVNEALLTKQGVRLGGARVGSPTSPASGVYKQIAINLQLVCTPKKTDPFLSIRGFVAGAISRADTARRRQFAIRALLQVQGIGDKRRK